MHFNLHKQTYANIYTYLHTLLHEDTTILDSVPIICIWEHSMETSVLFLQSVRLQVTHVPLKLACPKTYRHGISNNFEHFFLVKTEFIFFHSISYLEAIFVL